MKYRNRVNKNGNPPKFTAENVTNFIKERVKTDRSKNRNHGEGRRAERSVRLISENPNHATRKKQKSTQETTHRTSGDERKGDARNRDTKQEQNKESHPRSGQPQRRSIRIARIRPPEQNNLETMGLSQNHKEIRGDVILFAGSEEHQKETKAAK